MRHTVVISDVHLCEAVPGDSLWMRYRQRRFFPDADLARLFELVCAEVGSGALDLVFNGDLFDFDAPPVIAGEVRFDDQPRTEAVAVAALERILDDHDEFVRAVAGVLAAGHTVTFVSGNHDAQLAWPGVRDVLTARLVAATLAHTPGADRDAVRARVHYRAWFHRTDDGVHVEHGNQYDRFCAFRYPMEPYTPDGTAVEPTMGSLSFRHLVARMGYFNPHVDSSFMLSLPGYLAHWGRYYLLSRRSLGLTWAIGALRVAAEVWRARHEPEQSRVRRGLEACASETGADPAALERHAALFAPPSHEVLHAVARELWLDRAGLAALGAGVVALAALGGPAASLTLGGVAVAGIVAYELATPKVTLADTYAHVARCAWQIAAIHDARAVVFGHTHEAFGRWEDGVFFGNSGTWSAAFRDVACTVPVAEGRPVIWLRSAPGRPLEGGLYEWRGGMLLEANDRRSLRPGEAPADAAGSLEPVPRLQAG